MTAAECTDALRPMAGLARPCDAPNRHRRRQRGDRRCCAPLARTMGMAVVAGWDAAALTFGIRRSPSRSSNSAGRVKAAENSQVIGVPNPLTGRLISRYGPTWLRELAA